MPAEFKSRREAERVARFKEAEMKAAAELAEDLRVRAGILDRTSWDAGDEARRIRALLPTLPEDGNAD